MKIVCFSHNLEVNGSNKFLYSLLSGLNRTPENTVLLSPKDGAIRTKFEPYCKVEILPIESNDYELALRSRLREFDFGIVNTIIRSEAVVCLESLGIPNIWIIHESWAPENFDEMTKNVWKWSWPNLSTIKEAFRLTKFVFFPADITLQLYRPLYGQKAQPKVVCNGLDLCEFDFNMRTKQLNIDSEIVFSVVGSINERKNQLLAVEAFAQVSKKIKSAKLHLYGERFIRQHEIEYANQIRTFIAENDIKDRVTFFPAQLDITEAYLKSDVLICPSVSEVMPYVILEAMAMGCPVIASRIDGIPEVISHGRNGFMFESGNKNELASLMLSTVEDTDTYRRIQSSGLMTVRDNFTLEKMVKNYKENLAMIMKEFRNEY